MLSLASLRSRWPSLLGCFVAVTLGVAVMTAMGLGLAAALDPPKRPPTRFAASPVVVMGQDTVTMEVRRGPDTALASKPLAHPHPVDSALIAELGTLGRVRTDGAARDAVGVDAPVAAVRRLVGDRARVLTGDERHRADPSAARDAEALVGVDALLGTAAGVAAFVSVFVTASTFAFVVALRRREFGLLRLVGALPGQVRRTVLGEALAVGLTASAAGCALGGREAPLLVRSLVDGGVAPPWFALRDGTYWPYEVAFCTGVSVALAGAWASARRAGRTGPLESLREASVDTGVMPRSRRVTGVVLLAAGLGLTAWTLYADPAALLKRKTYATQPMVLITAVAVLAPMLVGPAVRLLPLQRLPRAYGLLIRENAAASVRRTAAVAAPVLVTVALAGSLLGSAATVTEARATEARERTRAQFVVTGEHVKKVTVPGATVSATASTAVFVREEGTALLRSDARAVNDVAAFVSVTRLPVVAGDVRDLDDRSIVVDEEWEHHKVGSWVSVRLGDGRPARLRIAAVLARGTGDNGAYVTTANAPGSTVDRLDARMLRGADPAAVAQALRLSGGTVRTTPAWLAATHPRGGPQTRLGLLVVLGIALVYAGISLAGTCLMATSARGAELRSLRRAGATRAQALGVVAGEAAVAVCVGAALGAVVAGVNLAGLAGALGRLSAPAGVVVPWGPLSGCVAVCLVIGVGASVAGAWRRT
ncbi:MULTISPECIES: FtsX-like permease family protein [unclassified Streptomyces]|uniref:FtsX-like permease family protein n=1 Tax=unclassified Streptomyces TaxID=2593676 RepID=UPI0022578031|nr:MULTISPECIES: FtsX-like permease family protein [unclassified Streptomyces]MCX4989427.1 ABC transporter permease [Streptomyces sp. NBC_00568]MCX5005351.1 ABC transporter permease [Streptomyces sp. NBC_00638]